MIYAFLITNMLFGQTLLARTFGGTSWDGAFSIAQTADKGFIAAGSTYSYGADREDFLVLKLNSDGSMSWARTFGGPGYERASSVTQTADGGYAIAGYTDSFGAGSVDFLVLKLDPDGSLEWARTFGGMEDEWAHLVTQTADGGFVVAGYTWSYGAGCDDFLVLKLNSDGSLIWARTFGGSGSEWASSATQTADGGFVVGGNTNIGAGDSDFHILKLDSDGSLSWAGTFGGTLADVAHSVTQTADGGFVLAGYTRSYSGGDPDLLILKLNLDGSLIWARTFGGTDPDDAWSVTPTADGGCVVTGETLSYGAGWYECFIFKLESDGSMSWARTFGGTGSDWAHSVTQTADGGFVVAGYTWSYGAGNADLMILKLDRNGNYPSCIQECSPIIGTLSLIASPPSVIAMDCSPSTSSPNLTVITPSPIIMDVCQPLRLIEEEVLPGSGITCSPISGGVLFFSPYDVGIRIYSVDGRLAYSGKLVKGENRIPIEAGIYLWTAGSYRGKMVIK
ncbi:MAG: hypothetical protein ABIM46_03055 [candidate division WOR-3 bacterium]